MKYHYDDCDMFYCHDESYSIFKIEARMCQQCDFIHLKFLDLLLNKGNPQQVVNYYEQYLKIVNMFEMSTKLVAEE